MRIDILMALLGGCLCGVISTLLIVAFAFAVTNKKSDKKEAEDANYECMDR